MPKNVDTRHEEALRRFQIIAPLLDPDSCRAEGRVWRRQICERSGTSARTLRRWLKEYRDKGLSGLYPKERKDKGTRRALSDEALELAQELRKELPERSAERVRDVLLANGHRATRSTLDRHLRLSGHSARILKRESSAEPNRGRRFQHSQRNSLWQSDYKAGPYLLNPKTAKKMPTWLLVIIDNATRKVMHAEFYFNQDSHSLFDGLHKAISSYGCPRRFHTDNGSAYTSNWTKLVCARLGVQHILARPYSPESKGCVERFNRTVEEFLREVQLEQPKTLLELNLRLRLWVGEGYNRRSHRVLSGKDEDGVSYDVSPEEAYAANTAPLRMVGPETLQQAFLWEEHRKVDKAGCISLHGTTYDTGLSLLRKTVELRFNPLDMSHVEIFYQGQSQGLARPLELSENNGVKRSSVRKEKGTGLPRSSQVLGVLAKQEKRRIAHDVGAFILSREEEESDA
jgi:transposase InsO family protein